MLTRFFIKCEDLIFKSLKLVEDRTFGSSIVQMNKLVCVMMIIDSLYTLMSYEDRIQKHVHEIQTIKDRIAGLAKSGGKGDHLTGFLYKRMKSIRELKKPTFEQVANEATSALFTLVVRYAVRCVATIVCRTETKWKPFENIFSLEVSHWQNVVGNTPSTYTKSRDSADSVCNSGKCGKSESEHHSPSNFCLLSIFQQPANEGQSIDDMSELRQQIRRRATESSTLSSAQRSQVSSLTQDLSSMPRTLLGDALTADEGHVARMEQEGNGESLVLSNDEFNNNESMRSLVKALFIIQDKWKMGITPDTATGAMPTWMVNLCKPLQCSSADFKVQLFLVKVIINYHKNLQRMATARDARDDMFKPFADQFFDAFFHETNGIATRISKNGAESLSAIEDQVI